MEYAPQWVGTFPRPGGLLKRPWASRPSVGADKAQPEKTQAATDAQIAQIEWVKQAQTGDLAAFEQLFNHYQRGIYNLVYQMVRNDSDAADITQDAFIRAWKALPRLQAPEAFGSWLYRVATN